jgi:hypothetical protein
MRSLSNSFMRWVARSSPPARWLPFRIMARAPWPESTPCASRRGCGTRQQHEGPSDRPGPATAPPNSVINARPFTRAMASRSSAGRAPPR